MIGRFCLALAAPLLALSHENGQPRSILVAEQDAPSTLGAIMTACDAMVDAGSKVIFVDHLQLIKAPADQIADRATEISEAPAQ